MRPRIILILTLMIAGMVAALWFRHASRIKQAAPIAAIPMVAPSMTTEATADPGSTASVPSPRKSTDGADRADGQRANVPTPGELLKQIANQTAKSSSQPLTDAVRKIVDTKGDYAQRAAAIKSLNSSLNKDQLGQLENFLAQRNSEDEQQTGQVLKNELMDQLTGLGVPGIDDTLQQVYSDDGQQIVLRDYALQHLIESAQVNLASGTLTRGQLSQLQESLWSAVKETDSSLAGTALLGLSRMSTKLPNDFSRAQVIQAANQLAADNSTGELTRVTAFQICGQMKANDVLPMLMQVAQSGASLPLRISAVGALGTLGSPVAQPLLNQIMQSGDPALLSAAKGALHQIKLAQRVR